MITITYDVVIYSVLTWSSATDYLTIFPFKNHDMTFYLNFNYLLLACTVENICNFLKYVQL